MAAVPLVADRFLVWLQEQIARYDRMVDQTEWQLDQVVYNEVAHALRRVRDEYKKASDCGCAERPN